MTDGSSKLCEWCEQSFRARRGGSPQRFCGGRCRMLFWSALRRSGERALAEGILTIAKIRTGAPAACTLCQRTELPLPLRDTRRRGYTPRDVPLRFFVEMERDRIAWLVKFRLIKADETHDLAAILTALKRIGLTPSISYAP